MHISFVAFRKRVPPRNALALSLPILAARRFAPYTEGMCKPIRDYLNLTRDYTREIITFGGLCLMCVVYSDFKQLAQAQASTAAHTVEVLRSMDARLCSIEKQAR